MIVLIFGILGVIWGVVMARRRGGNRLDMAQYGAGYGILGAVIGLILAIVILRNA